MFHPDLVAARLEQLARSRPDDLPPGGIHRYTVADCQYMQKRLATTRDDRGRQLRALTRDEFAFVQNERLLGKLDYGYWAERYCMINIEGAGVAPMFPLWASQQLILERIAAIELKHAQLAEPEGVLANILKARQLGASTFSESVVAHRTTQYSHITGMIASDDPESSAKMYRIYRRIVEYLPWYLKPTITDDVKNQEMAYATGSRIEVAAGKSTRGTIGERGQLGRSGTYSCLHLSEVSTWENADQIDGALLPAVPRSPRVIMLTESTAKGRLNWWHKHWLATKRGLTRFVNIFIPWYAETSKYWAPAPATWSPNVATVKHARRCEATSAQWLGRRVTLTREQLYWYERTRASYEAKDDLATFLEEYCADDEECFQYAGRSIFPLAVRERIRQQAKPLIGILAVEPRRAQTPPPTPEPQVTDALH